MKNLLLLFMMLCTTAAFAQHSISGKVVDGETGEALIGASVAVKGTTTGSLTDVDGMFTIPGLSDGTYTIVTSYVGYEDASTKVTVSGGDVTVANIRMNEGGVNLESVVITGTMDIVRDRRTPVAVSTIGVREIQANAGNVEFPELDEKYTFNLCSWTGWWIRRFRSFHQRI